MCVELERDAFTAAKLPDASMRQQAQHVSEHLHSICMMPTPFVQSAVEATATTAVPTMQCTGTLTVHATHQNPVPYTIEASHPCCLSPAESALPAASPIS
jgi:hypothetical protein